MICTCVCPLVSSSILPSCKSVINNFYSFACMFDFLCLFFRVSLCVTCATTYESIQYYTLVTVCCHLPQLNVSGNTYTHRHTHKYTHSRTLFDSSYLRFFITDLGGILEPRITVNITHLSFLFLFVLIFSPLLNPIS